MNLPNKLASDLLKKDRNISSKAASEMIENTDIEAWGCLVENDDYIFDFIKDIAGKKLLNATNKNNINNLFTFLKYHSIGFENALINIFLSFKNDEITAKFKELIENGGVEEKAYATKYFCEFKTDGINNILFENSKSEFDPLATNSGICLGKLKDPKSYNYYLEKLKTDDDWEKLNAATFLVNYNDKKALKPLLEAMQNSSMQENIAGEIAFFVNISEYFEDKDLKELALECFDNVLSALSNIYPLSCINALNIFETIETLVYLANQNNEEMQGKYAQLLIKAKAKFDVYANNNEYNFDEDKNTKEELKEIDNFLKSFDENFWVKQKEYFSKELNSTTLRKLCAINTIQELELKEFSQNLKNLLENETDENVIFRTITTLKEFNEAKDLNKQSILDKIQDETKQRIIESLLI